MTQVYFSKESRKIFQKLQDETLRLKITKAIRLLSQNPNAGKKLQGRLSGTYSIRIWPYRILYEFTKDNDIIVTDIRHRKGVYR